jgi:hypothetical protein
MRWGSLFLVVALIGGACGDDDIGATAISTTTATAASTVATGGPLETTTTTTPPLTDPRFPETNMSARFALPNDEEATLPFDPASLLALFYRSTTGPLVVVLTGFGGEVSPVLQCGWILMQYGTTAVLDAPSWDEAPWDSYGNQPWATQNFGTPRCEDEFLEDGAFRSDITFAHECGDFLMIVADQLELDPAVAGAEVATPFAELIVDAPDGPVSLEAIPWEAHPGALPTVADLVGIDVAAVSCPEF